MPSARVSADLLPLKCAMASDLVMVEPDYEPAHIGRPIGFRYEPPDTHCVTDETHGARIKRLRLAKGWTQNDLEAEASIDQSTLSGIEKRNAMPKWDTLGRIAAALGTTRDYLMEGRSAAWPFSVSMDRFMNLKPGDRQYVEGALVEAIRTKEKPTNEPELSKGSMRKAAAKRGIGTKTDTGTKRRRKP